MAVSDINTILSLSSIPANHAISKGIKSEKSFEALLLSNSNTINKSKDENNIHESIIQANTLEKTSSVNKQNSPVWEKYYERVDEPNYTTMPDKMANIPVMPFMEIKGDSYHIDTIDERLEIGMEVFSGEFNKWKFNAGIPSNPPIELKSDYQGKIKVQGEHPNKDEIEAYFEKNDDMANFFKEMSHAKSFLEISKETAEFHKAYRNDPRAAVGKYSHLFSGNYHYDTSMCISDSEYEFSSKPINLY